MVDGRDSGSTATQASTVVCTAGCEHGVWGVHRVWKGCEEESAVVCRRGVDRVCGVFTGCEHGVMGCTVICSRVRARASTVVCEGGGDRLVIDRGVDKDVNRAWAGCERVWQGMEGWRTCKAASGSPPQKV